MAVDLFQMITQTKCEFAIFILVVLVVSSGGLFRFCRVVAMQKKTHLKQSLLEIDKQRGEKKVEMETLEEECLKLLRKYDAPEEKGEINAAVAFMYANEGMRQPTKVAEYCEKALSYPLKITKACQLYVYWGESLEAKHSDSKSDIFVAVRRQIVMPYLTGLKLVLDNQTTREIQEPPAVGKYRYDGPTSDPQYRKMLKKHKDEISKRKRVILQNKLVEYRKVFTSKCVALYSRKPFATDELERIAIDILKNREAVKELVTEVKAGIN